MFEEKTLKAVLSEKKKKIILDTDAFNEMDDQFAIAYALLSDNVDVISFNAAPFCNRRSEHSFKKGMERSYEEIKTIISLTDNKFCGNVYKGSTRLFDEKSYEDSEAANNIINTALKLKDDETLFVVAIGAITNVANAVLKNKKVFDKITVLWLGGNALDFVNNSEFNLRQDLSAARYVFDNVENLIQIPCGGVCSLFQTSIKEIAENLRGKNPLADYLCAEAEEFAREINEYDKPRVIWDISTIGFLVNPAAYKYEIIGRRKINADGLYVENPSDKKTLYITNINRDAIYGDCFIKIANCKNSR